MRQCMAAQPRFPVEAAPEVLADFVEFLASRSPPSGDLDELVAAQRRRPGDGEDSSEEEEALDEFGTMLMANRRRDQPQRRRH